MVATITLEKAFKDKRVPKLLKINFQVQECTTKKKMKIRDGSTGNFSLEIIDPKLIGSKYFEIGKFVKVINASLRKNDLTILIDNKSIICRGDPISSLEVPSPFQPLASTLELNGNTIIPGKILAKVVRVFDPKGPIPSKFEGMRAKFVFQIKDIHGTRQTIAIWKPWNLNNICPVEINKVYEFSNVKTDNYLDKPYWLIGDINCIKAASKDHEETLKNVGVHDGKFNGTVVAINNIKLFKSCNKCSSSIEVPAVGSTCPKCKKELEIVVDDFSFTMTIESGADLIPFTGFKKTVNFQGPCTDEDTIEDLLNSQFEGKVAVGEYIKSEKFHVAAIHEIKFS